MEIFVRKNALPSQDKQAILEAVRKLYPQVLDIEINACFFLWLDEQMEELNKRYCQSLLCAEHIRLNIFGAPVRMYLLPQEMAQKHSKVMLYKI